jgi:hydroxyacylglutathione hydrolase
LPAAEPLPVPEPVLPLDLATFRLLSDNTGALLHDPATGACAAVDVPDATGVLAEARRRGWAVDHIFLTHEHPDHVQGVAALKAATGAQVIGPAEAAALCQVDRIVGEGDEVALGAARFAIWATPGHARGHLSWVAEAERLALVGDVLFVMGCGRLSGETAAEMFRSLARLAALPDDARLVTGHDYTHANARFARHVDPDNAALAARAAEAEAAAREGRFWSVTTLAEEKATNPYLRAHLPALARAAGREQGPPEAVFAALRQLKNGFAG